MTRDERSRLLIGGGEVAIILLSASGAVAKLVELQPAFEAAEAVMEDPWLAVVIVAGALAIECGLVAALALRLLCGHRALLAGCATLGAFTLWLALVRSRLGPSARCGCFGPSSFGRSATAAMIANGVVLVALVAALLATASRAAPLTPPAARARTTRGRRSWRRGRP